MSAQCLDLNLVFFELIVGHLQIVEQLRVLTLVLVQLLHVVQKSLVDADLHEFFEGDVLVRSVLQVDIGLFRHE